MLESSPVKANMSSLSVLTSIMVKLPFLVSWSLFSTFLLPSIMAWRQEGVAEAVVGFFSKWKGAVILYMKMHVLALWPRRRREVDEDKIGNKLCQQLSHHNRRRLSQAFNGSNQSQDLEKMDSLGISASRSGSW